MKTLSTLLFILGCIFLFLGLVCSAPLLLLTILLLLPGVFLSLASGFINLKRRGSCAKEGPDTREE